MVRILNDFARKHSFAGTLNKAGVYRDSLHFYNHEFDLPYVYGISGLFGFSFNSLGTNIKGLNEKVLQNDELYPDFKLPPFFASGNYFFGLNNALRATNVWCQRGAKIDKSEFIELLKTYIGEGRPILLDVEQLKWYELSKMAEIVDETYKSDFANYQKYLQNSSYKIGDYNILCIGYDDDKSTFSILDTNTTQIITIGFDELYSCTNVHDIYCTPANKWFVFYVPPQLPEKKGIVTYSILYAINSMINPFKTDNSLLFGIKGLEAFSDEFKNACKSFCQEDLNKIGSYLLYSSSSLNSTHDYNRLVYSDFLLGSADVLKNRKIENTAQLYRNLSNEWNEFFAIINHSKNSQEIIKTNAFSILEKIVENEKKAIISLKESL